MRNITDFGIFVGVEEGIDGLVHVSDLHWTKKIKHPSELYKKGDVVEAVVLGVDVENERISLGIKQLAPDPWKVVAERYPVGAKSKARSPASPTSASSCASKRARGLIHVSQLSTERVDKPSSFSRSATKSRPRSSTSIRANERSVSASGRCAAPKSARRWKAI